MRTKDIEKHLGIEPMTSGEINTFYELEHRIRMYDVSGYLADKVVDGKLGIDDVTAALFDEMLDIYCDMQDNGTGWRDDIEYAYDEACRSNGIGD